MTSKYDSSSAARQVRWVRVIGSAVCIFALYGFHAYFLSIEKHQDSFLSRHLLAQPGDDVGDDDDGATTLLADEDTTMSTTASGPNYTLDCLPPAILEFPRDAFTQSQRQRGGVVFHMLLVMYMFCALAIVCDDFFIASLDKLGEKLGFSEDVAGATLMAAGSSAPELFTALIGVFVAKGDVGFGTIVGSAVFNILCVVGVCGLCIKQACELSWWPLTRDSVYYALAVLVLILSIYDGEVSWVESLIMLLLYVLYIVIMKFNKRIQTFVFVRLHLEPPPPDHPAGRIMGSGMGAKTKYYGDYEVFEDDEEASASASRDLPEIPLDQRAGRTKRRIRMAEAACRVLMGRRFRPKTRFSFAARVIIDEYRHQKKLKRLHQPFSLERNTGFFEAVDELRGLGDGKDDSPWHHKPRMSQDGVLALVKWSLLFPINITLYYSIPNCRNPRFERWYPLTFVMSILWIALYSYLMVWMVTVIGYTINIPDSIMGITFLAAGTSIPDAMASIIVAKQGLGDMAVSNSIGSNVFDILIGLALPWFIKTAFVSAGTTVHINSNGLIYNVLLLFAAVAITIGGIHLNKWVLNKRMGIICLVLYAIFLIFSVMIESNVFGYVNPPMCDD